MNTLVAELYRIAKLIDSEDNQRDMYKALDRSPFRFDVGGYVTLKDGTSATEDQFEEISNLANLLKINVYIDQSTGKIRWKHRW